MTSKFEDAILYIKNLPKTVTVSQEDQLSLYKYYKQATVGNCNIKPPGMFQLVEKKKYEAWKSVENLSQEESKQKYVELVNKLFPDWKKGST